MFFSSSCGQKILPAKWSRSPAPSTDHVPTGAWPRHLLEPSLDASLRLSTRSLVLSKFASIVATSRRMPIEPSSGHSPASASRSPSAPSCIDSPTRSCGTRIGSRDRSRNFHHVRAHERLQPDVVPHGGTGHGDDVRGRRATGGAIAVGHSPPKLAVIVVHLHHGPVATHDGVPKVGAGLRAPRSGFSRIFTLSPGPIPEQAAPFRQHGGGPSDGSLEEPPPPHTPAALYRRDRYSTPLSSGLARP